MPKAAKSSLPQSAALPEIDPGNIEELHTLDNATLKGLWVKHFRSQPPLRSRKSLLVDCLAYRINEVCQVNPQCDVQEEEGIWFFDFNEESASDERVTKSVKTAGSRRKTPIHSKLLELGFLSYVELMKKQGSTLLFPQWIPTRGRASPAGEDWFRQFLAETGLRDETQGRTLLGMHAFRHTLMNYGFNNHIANIEVITGHAGEASRVVRP